MCANNDTIVNDLTALTHDDLLDSSEKLAESYRNLKAENDQQKQQIHSQIREIRTLSMTQNDFFELQAEMENMNEQKRRQVEDSTAKNQSDELKAKLSAMEYEMTQLQEKFDLLQSESREKDAVIDNLREDIKLKSKPRQSFSHEYQLKIEQLTHELDEMRSHQKNCQRQIEEKNRQIENMTEEATCTRENLESKKMELEEKNTLIEDLQEKNLELTMEISSMRTAPADDKSKGNSLFAEVDDQRKMMKEVLQREHSSQAEMKKILNFKDVEIRKLRRENQNIKNDIQACSTLLMRSEKINDETHRIQVDLLEKEVKRLENDLKEAQERLVDLAKNRKMGWIDTLVSMNEESQRESREKLMRALMDNSLLSDNLLAVQRDLARTQMKSVQLKTLLTRIVDRKSIRVVESDYRGIGIDAELLESLKFEEVDTTTEENTSLNESDFTFEENKALNSTPNIDINETFSPKKPLHSSENIMKTPPTPPTEAIIKPEIIKAQPIASLKRVPVVVKRTVIPRTIKKES